MSELGDIDEAAALLVEVRQALDELVHRVTLALLVHRLVNRQELLETDAQL